MFSSINEIKRANTRAGRFFFAPATMRFFDSRVLSRVVAGRYFVTSERFDANSPRLYTARMARDDGEIDTIGEFQEHQTAAAAYRAIDRQVKRAE